MAKLKKEREAKRRTGFISPYLRKKRLRLEQERNENSDSDDLEDDISRETNGGERPEEELTDDQPIDYVQSQESYSMSEDEYDPNNTRNVDQDSNSEDENPDPNDSGDEETDNTIDAEDFSDIVRMVFVENHLTKKAQKNILKLMEYAKQSGNDCPKSFYYLNKDTKKHLQTIPWKCFVFCSTCEKVVSDKPFKNDQFCSGCSKSAGEARNLRHNENYIIQFDLLASLQHMINSEY